MGNFCILVMVLPGSLLTGVPYHFWPEKVMFGPIFSLSNAEYHDRGQITSSRGSEPPALKRLPG